MFLTRRSVRDVGTRSGINRSSKSVEGGGEYETERKMDTDRDTAGAGDCAGSECRVNALNATNDGFVSENTKSDFCAFRLDIGDSATNNAADIVRTDVTAHATNGWYDYNQRGLVTFNGAAIPDGATINSAVA